jgi:hypothetical protein
MAASSKRDGCRRPYPDPDPVSRRAPVPAFRRLPGYLRHSKAVFAQILCRCFRIAGTYCRHRWFVRYARSESLLCAMIAPHVCH